MLKSKKKKKEKRVSRKIESEKILKIKESIKEKNQKIRTNQKIKLLELCVT